MWSIDEVLEKLKSRGYKLIGQRKAIIEKLCGRKDHPTAEQLYSESYKKVTPPYLLLLFMLSCNWLSRDGLLTDTR